MSNRIKEKTAHIRKVCCEHLKSTNSRLWWLLGWSFIPTIILVAILFYGTYKLKDIQNLLVISLGAIPACVLWYYRDKAKQIDQGKKEREIKIAETKLANEEAARISTLIARISDKETAKTERVYIAYQLSESLPEDIPEDREIIKILEIFRSLIEQKNNTNDYLVESIQKILITFIRAGKYSWYRFVDFNFAGASFMDLDLSGYNFINCSFRNSKFWETKISTFRREAPFKIAISWLDHCDFRKAQIKETSFSEARLSHVDFSGCIFDNDVDFTNAKIENSKFNNTTLNCNFTEVEFNNTEFFGAIIIDDIIMDKNVKGVLYNIELHDNRQGYNMKHNYNENGDLIREQYEPCTFQSCEDCDRPIDNNKELEKLLGHPIEHNCFDSP